MNLIALLFLGMLLGGSSERSSSKVATQLKLPPHFTPIPGTRRIVESQYLVTEEDGRSYLAKSYAPPMKPPPWEVRAWFKPHRLAHVIDIRAHPALEAGALTAKVFAGERCQPNRAAFRECRKPLWPDDKYQNRVVHRVSRVGVEVCFLIDITVYDFHLDFYHEPLVEVESVSLCDETPKAEERRRFAQLREIEELEKEYTDKRGELANRADLAPELRRELEAHLMRAYEAELQAILGET